jgi:beta-mannosidase
VFSKILAQTTAQFSNTGYWGSSPKWGRGDKRSLEEGDCHYWGVWHDGEPFEILQTKIPRFMSEFGMQSYPSNAVLEEMCETTPCNEKDPGKLVHQKHPRGFLLMHEYMKKWYPTGETLSSPDYGKLTQYVQAEGVIMGIEAQRRHQDRCGGTLIWQLNDVWPAYSWSAMDYRFNEKPLMEQLSFAFAPLLASLEWNQGQLQVYLINEFPALQNVQCVIKIHRQEQEEIIFNQNIEIQNGSEIIFQTTNIPAAADQMLSIELTHAEIANGKYFRKMKLIPLSHQFLVPDVINGKWSCKNLLD